MPYLIGILLEVSFSMKAVFEAFGDKAGNRASSVFSVVNGLIGKRGVLPANDIFAISFGAQNDSSVFDLLGSLQNFRQNYDKEIILRDYEHILKNIFRHLNVSDMYIQTFLSEDFKANVPPYMLKLLSDGLDNNRELAKGIKDNYKKSIYENFVSYLKSWLPKNLIFNEAAEITTVVEKIKQTFLNDPKVKELLLESTIHAFDFKTALEILRYWLEGKKLNDDRIRGLLKSIGPLIYGSANLLQTLHISGDIFVDEKYVNHKKYLFLLSTQVVSNEEALTEQLAGAKDRFKENTVKIICCYIVQPGNDNINSRPLFASEQEEWDASACTLFRLSSGMSTLLLPEAIFRARGWKIQTNNDKIKLFLQINHPDHIKEVCNLVEEVESSKDALLNILGNVSLAKYLSKAKGREEQKGGTCYAHASAAVLHLAMKRILNRKDGYPDFDKLLDIMIDRYGEEGAQTFNVLRDICPFYRLNCRSVTADEAIDALSNGRPLVALYRLTDKEWYRFSTFFHHYPKGILTKDIIDIDERKAGEKTSGHAVVLTSSNSECFRFMNSWGGGWVDMGFFRVKNEDVLDMEFIDVFWTENELEDVEKSYFQEHGASVAKLLIHSFSGLAEKKYQCPKCMKESKVEEFNGSFLKVFCPKCKKEFEGGTDIVTNLYLSCLLQNQ